MALFLLLLFIVVPIAELAVIIAVAHHIGVIWTLILLFGVGIAGSILAKQQGIEVWNRVRTTLARGEMPSTEVVDGALVLLAGALLLSPGFLTDVVGVVLLIPPARVAIRKIARRRFRGFVDRRVFGASPSGRGPRRARVVRVASRRKPTETGMNHPESRDRERL